MLFEFLSLAKIQANPIKLKHWFKSCLFFFSDREKLPEFIVRLKYYCIFTATIRCECINNLKVTAQCAAIGFHIKAMYEF